MKTTFFCVFFLCSTLQFAQDSTIVSQFSFGGSGFDGCKKIVKTPDGGFIISGLSRSSISGNKTEPNIGGQDFWIIKLHGDYTIEWQNTIGGAEDDIPEEILLTPDGGYIVAGSSWSNSSSDKSENNHGIGPDYWVMKLDSEGQIVWENTIGGDGIDRLESFVEANDGGYILGGLSYSDISGDKTENSIGIGWESDFWLVKINDLGNVVWDQTIGGTSFDDLIDLETFQNGYILGGASSSNISGDKTENSIGMSDFWVVRIDNSGNVEWDNTIGGTDRESLADITPTSDNGYIMIGWSESNASGDKTENNHGAADYWVVKLNELGIVEWDNTIGGALHDSGRVIIERDPQEYIVGGHSESGISGDKIENSNGGFDVWLLSLDGQGEILQQNAIGGDGWDYIESMHVATTGELWLGNGSSSSISGDRVAATFGDSDIWLVELSDIITLGLATREVPLLSVYPNPVEDELVISSPENKIQNVSVYNTYGGLLSLFLVKHEQNFEINTSNWFAGMYILKIEMDGQTFYRKVLKQ